MDSGDRRFAIAQDVFVMIVIAVVIVGLAVAVADQQVPKRLGVVATRRARMASRLSLPISWKKPRRHQPTYFECASHERLAGRSRSRTCLSIAFLRF